MYKRQLHYAQNATMTKILDGDMLNQQIYAVYQHEFSQFYNGEFNVLQGEVHALREELDILRKETHIRQKESHSVQGELDILKHTVGMICKLMSK